MKPFLVHLHLYYTEMWIELREKIKNIEEYPYDLYVTLVEDDPQLVEKILEFKSDAHIEIVENRGFDVGPFVQLINSVNLNDYSYVIKVHSKRYIEEKRTHVNAFDMSGNRWKDYLLEFLESKEVFNNYLNCMEKNKKLGMIANYKIIVSSSSESKKTRRVLDDFCCAHQIESIKYNFIAGTMFIARTDIFIPVKKMNISLSDFEFADKEIRNRQLAHIFERLFGLFAYSQGYVVDDPFTSGFKQTLIKCSVKLKKIIYQNEITTSGKRIIKICKIPIYSKKQMK